MQTQSTPQTQVGLEGFGFRGVAVSDDAATIRFEREVQGEDNAQVDDLTFDIPDRPHQDLLDVLNRLTRQYLDVLELPSEQSEYVEIKAVELQDSNPPEIKVGGERYLPGIDETIKVAAPAAPPIDGKVQDVLYALMREAILCVEGKRHQLSLFEPEAPPQAPGRAVPEGEPNELPAGSVAARDAE